MHESCIVGFDSKIIDEILKNLLIQLQLLHIFQKVSQAKERIAASVLIEVAPEVLLEYNQNLRLIKNKMQIFPKALISLSRSF